MGNIRAALAPLLADARLDLSEAKTLTGRIPGTPAAEATADLVAIAKQYAGVISEDAWGELETAARTLGVTLPAKPRVDVLSQPELAGVAAGRETLSLANRKAPGVPFVQTALMVLANKTGNAAFALPKFGADGDFGSETTAAVKAFQFKNRLPQTGTVDQTTLRALKAALIAPPPATGAPKNLRFADPVFAQIAAGAASFAKGARGESVKTIQQVLSDLAYPLPSGVDGAFGNETLFAIKQFQTDRGLPVTGRIDQATLRKLDEIAPAKDAQAVTYPEYDQLFKNGVMMAVLGIGYDETGADLYEIQAVKSKFFQRGFREITPGTMTDAQITELGLDPATIDRQGTYFVKKFQFKGRDVVSAVKYVDRNTVNPRERYIEAMKTSGLVMYGGHARYGSGPDFDDINSPAGNVVLGANAAGHRNGSLVEAYDAHMRSVIAGAPNVLEKEKLTDNYQLMFFSGCSTHNYLDELRALPKNKTGSNLDTFTSKEILYWNHMADNTFAMLDGVMSGKSTQAIQAQLQEINDGVGFIADGTGGNTYKP
jgi:peptidoglycan hydrolase-like protein with peptidoglycan-binding domain